MDDNSAQREGVLILLDIDNFKVVNDRFGHLEGDAVLRYVTKLLETTFRREDLVGRLGGDEFIVFLKGPVSRDILDQRMEKLYTALDAYPNIPISCSAGVTFIEQKNFSYTDSIQQADVALYKSKKEGKRHYTYVEEQNAEKTCI